MNNVFCLLTIESGSSMPESIPLWILRDASIFGMDEPTERGNQNSSFDTLWMSDEDKKNYWTLRSVSAAPNECVLLTLDINLIPSDITVSWFLKQIISAMQL